MKMSKSVAVYRSHVIPSIPPNRGRLPESRGTLYEPQLEYYVCVMFVGHGGPPIAANCRGSRSNVGRNVRWDVTRPSHTARQDP